MGKRVQLTKRQSAILHCLREDAPVSGDYLAKTLGVSSKTIGREISELSELLPRHGATVCSKTGVGHLLQITDREQYAGFLTEQQREPAQQSKIPFFYQRVHYIMRRLLLVDGYVKLGDLAEELYSSRTTITSDMRYVKEELAFYDIAVEQRPNHGVCIRAREHDIRLCLVDEYAYYHHRQTVPPEQEYDDLLRLDEEQRRGLEQILFEALREFTDIDVPYRNIIKIIRLIALTPRRRDYSMVGSYTEEEIYSTTQRATYNAAKYIAKRCGPFLGYTFTREDLVLLTLYLVGYRDFIQVDGITRQNRFLTMHRFAEQLIDELCAINSFDSVYRDASLCNTLALHLLSMKIRMEYHIKIDHSLNSQIKLRVGSVELAVQSSRIIEREWGRRMDENEICSLALVIYPIFGRYNTEHKKKNIILLSSISKSYGQSVAERFYRNFPAYLQHIEVLEVQDLETADLGRYSCIFSDVAQSLLPSVALPVVPYSTFFGEREKLAIRYVLTLGNNHFKQVQHYFSPDLYFTNLLVRDRDEALEQVYRQLHRQLAVPPTFLEDIRGRSNRCCAEMGNAAAVMKTMDCHIPRSFMSVFLFDRPIQWKFEYVQLLVVWHLDPGDRVSVELFESGFFGRVLRSIFGSSDNVVHLLQNPDYTAFSALLKKFSSETLG